MTDWESQIFDVLAHQRNSFLQNSNKIRTDADAIRERLRSVSEDVSDKEWKKFQATLNQFADAVGADGIGEAAAKEVGAQFELMSKNTNPALSILGSYGVSTVAVLRQDFHNAALSLYRATETYPAAAIQAFDPQFFKPDYREIVTGSYKELQRTIRAHRDISQTNRPKRSRSFPTFVIRSLVVAPLNYLLATASATGPLPQDQRVSSYRSNSYQNKVRTIFEWRMKAFDSYASACGWVLSTNEQQKEHMLLDQVKRITTIYQNHVLSVTQDAKAKRRELEKGGA